MFTLEGYDVHGSLPRNLGSRVFRAARQADGEPVFLKLPLSDYPEPEEIARIRYEFEIMRDLKGQEVLKAHGLVNVRNIPVLVIEDFGGVPLSDSPSLDLRPFLNTAVQITSALGSIHQQGVIHKDIKPHNIFRHPVSGQVKVGDFSISSRLEWESGQSGPELAGSLPYISPEQTGRMNRPVDLRSDLYSLGATFYHLLAGRPPFTASDPLELVHCHIARTPAPLHHIRPDLPDTVSAIVEKLLSKSAEERYQSALGVRLDLERCLKQLELDGTIRPFPPGSEDVSDRFQLPQKLYGRETELEQLDAAFSRVRDGARELLLVSGYPGVGKTALIREVNRPLTARRGSFIAGKYEQYKRDIPYLGLLQSLREFLRLVLSQPEASVNAWRERLQEALGENAPYALAMGNIPELALILGPNVETAQPIEEGTFASRHRFSEAILACFRSLGRADHPLVLFLDDLQWADDASFIFLEKLITDSRTRHLLVIGAYRKNEVAEDHPLALTLKKLRAQEDPEQRANLAEIRLNPLSLADATRYTADTVRRTVDDDTVAELARIAYEKTNGNPFFLGEFLKGMYADEVLRFQEGRWTWSESEVRGRAVTDNVVDLLTARLRRLSPRTIEVLKVAAAAGNRFDLRTLAIARGQAPGEVAGALWEALRTGLVQPLDELYKYVEFLDETTEAAPSTAGEYRFRHDRVQQAAYSLLGREEKAEIHWKIGRHLHDTLAGEDDARVIDVANHLNNGRPETLDRDTLLDLARINQWAGRRARASAAFYQSARYFEFALAALPDDGWSSCRELTHAVYVEAAESLYLGANPERADELAALVLKESKNVLERVPIFITRIQLQTANNKLPEAVDSALEILAELGVRPPDDPNLGHILLGFARTKFALRGRTPESLVHLPPMRDAHALATLEVISKAITAIMIAKPRLMPLVVYVMVRRSVQYGNCKDSAYGYAMFGLILSGPVGDIESGYRMGNAALALGEKLHSAELEGQINLVYNLFIRHWKEPERNTVEPLLTSARRNYDSGNLILASFALANYNIYRFYVGDSLEAHLGDLEHQRRRLLSYGSETTLPYFDILAQAIVNLCEPAGDPFEFVGESFQSAKDLPALIQTDNLGAAGFYHATRMMIAVLCGESSRAVKDLEEFQGYEEMLAGFMLLPRTIFFAALIYIDEADRTGRKTYLRKARKELGRLRKWSRFSPENNLRRVRLIEAELAARRGDIERAGRLFDQAVESAEQEDHAPETALANQRAAEFYTRRGQEKIARSYWMDARYAFARWGALSRVRSLDDRLGGILPRGIAPAADPAATEHATRNVTVAGHSRLDVDTILRGARAISEEIRLDRLLDRMLRLLIENAGAGRGIFLLSRDGELYIEASGDTEPGSIEVLQHIPLEQASQNLPLSVVQFALRARENVVLHSVDQDAGRFGQDPYFAKTDARSLLCMPVLRGRELVGVLYLENRLTAGAFTNERVAPLEFLCSQTAISLENALHYDDLESRIKERTRELSEAHARLLDLQKQATERQMAGGFAHEMRNALAGCRLLLERALGRGDGDADLTMNVQNARRIKDVAQRLSEKLDPQELHEYLSVLQTVLSDMKQMDGFLDLIYQATLRGLAITTRIMNYSQIGSEEKGGETIDVVEMLESILAEEAHTFERDGIEARLDYERRPVTQGSRIHFHSVFYNIISNAAFALAGSDHSGRLIRITITDEADQARVVITDNGPGIAPEHLDRVFDPFFSTKPETGTGLGLGEVKKILSVYGGDVTVRSPLPGGGAEFTITFPASSIAAPGSGTQRTARQSS